MKTCVDKLATELTLHTNAITRGETMLGTTDTALAMTTIILCSWAYGLLVYMFATWGDDRGDL